MNFLTDCKKIIFDDIHSYMSEKHFGKQLAKMMGVDLNELNASVEQSISERLHIRLDDGFYIKNAYEYFKDRKIHYLNDSHNQTQSASNQKIASYIILNHLKNDSNLDHAIWYFEDEFDDLC